MPLSCARRLNPNRDTTIGIVLLLYDTCNMIFRRSNVGQFVLMEDISGNFYDIIIENEKSDVD
jgi:hypothetical protein